MYLALMKSLQAIEWLIFRLFDFTNYNLFSLPIRLQ